MIDGWRPAPRTTACPMMNPTATATMPTCQLLIATTPYQRPVARTAPIAPPTMPPTRSPIVAGSGGAVAATSATGIAVARTADASAGPAAAWAAAADAVPIA